MSKAVGVFKRVSYAKEISWGTAAGPSGAKQLRRVTANFNLAKDQYTSNELNNIFQVIDSRHGVRTADGSLAAELSPGSYSQFFGSLVAKDFAAGVTATGLGLAIAASGTNFTITRSSGSWITDGFNVGNAIRITSATGANAVNLNNNALVISMTATVLTVQVLSRFSFVVDPAITAATVAVIGKVTQVPTSGHTNDSYTVEQWYSDIGQSEVFTGLKVSTAAVSLPATGLVTANFTLKGKDLAQTGTSEYFTTPALPTTTGIFAAVQGALIVNGQAGACVTSADFSITRNQSNATCVGSNSVSDIFVGKITATGNMSAYFSDGTLRDYFANETPVSLVLALTTSTEKNADVVTFVFPKIKLNSANAADAETGIVQSIAWNALYNDVVTAGLPNTTVMIQDTQAV